MIKAKYPARSADTIDKELLLVSRLGTHLSNATTIEKIKVYTIKEIDKMIVGGPDSACHKVKLERITREGGWSLYQLGC